MKRILLTIGTISAIAPISMVIACAEKEEFVSKYQGVNVELEARIKETKPGFENGTKIMGLVFGENKSLNIDFVKDKNKFGGS
jgi:hypothetical protein